MTQYSAPSITRHLACGMNPVAAHDPELVCDSIDGCDVEQLLERHGSPVFAFSERAIREAHQTLRSSCVSIYPHTELAWSYKTNYLKAICQVFHSEGSLAEVVSGFEYEKARANDVPPERIIFNGPCKSELEIERAIQEGARLQADHFDELALIDTVAGRLGQTVKIGLRVCVDTGLRPLWSKFGFADGDELDFAFRWIADSGGRLQLAGLHAHIGTGILDPQAYRKAAKRLIEIGDDAEAFLGKALEYFNLGGGIPSSAQLHGSPRAVPNPPAEEYARAICEPFRDRFQGERRAPRLILESGRSLIDDAGSLLTTILATKRATPALSNPVREVSAKIPAETFVSQDVRPALIIDAGIHLLYPAAWFRYEVHTTRPFPEPVTSTRLMGCLCMNIDVIREDVLLPPVTTGDHLVIHPVGAYCFTQSMQFITYRPRVVLIDLQGRDHVIRERENLEHVEALDRVPQHLQGTP